MTTANYDDSPPTMLPLLPIMLLLHPCHIASIASIAQALIMSHIMTHYLADCQELRWRRPVTTMPQPPRCLPLPHHELQLPCPCPDMLTMGDSPGKQPRLWLTTADARTMTQGQRGTMRADSRVIWQNDEGGAM